MAARKKLQMLTSSRQFRVVYDQGVRFHTTFFSLFFLRTTEGEPRLGITVTRKIGPAVVRNRCKRRLREVARRDTLSLFAGVGCDIVINAKSGMLSANLNDLTQAFSCAMVRFRETIVDTGEMKAE